MKKTLLAGSLAYDRIMDFQGHFKDHFLPDKLHQISVSFLVNGVTEEFGGTAGNIAYGLALLGESAAVAATAGTDFARYEEHLRSRGVDTDAVAHADVATASAYITTDQENNQITAFAPGACGVPYAGAIDWNEIGLLHIAPTCAEDMERLPREAKAAGVPVFFDPGQQIGALSPEILRTSIDGADALFVNDYELALVIEKTGWSEDEIVGKVRVLVVTLGEHGSRLRTKDHAAHIDAVKAEAVDPTGAGDAYRAGFIAGHAAGLSDEQSTKVGATLAAFAV